MKAHIADIEAALGSKAFRPRRYGDGSISVTFNLNKLGDDVAGVADWVSRIEHKTVKPEQMSTRALQHKIDSMLFERTALSKKPELLAQQELSALRTEDRMTPDLVFRDPYILDFLRLKDTYSEDDLESAILREMEQFLLELGAGFSFVARQYRMVIGNEDFYLDLLFFHRKLHRLIAIELKIGHFKASYKGQMELYLRWLEEHEKESFEEQPLGLILCAGADQEQIRLLQLDKSGIHVSEYLTDLPPREVLEKKLRSAMQAARERLAAQGANS